MIFYEGVETVTDQLPEFPDGATQEEIQVVRNLMTAELVSEGADTRLGIIRIRAAKGEPEAVRVVAIETALNAIKAKAAREAWGREKPEEEQ